MNVKEKLDKRRFRTFNVHGLITDTRIFIEEEGPLSFTIKIFIKDLIDREIDFSNEVEARIFIKKLMVELYEANYIINPIEIDNVVADCWEYTNNFVNNPEWNFLFSKSEELIEGEVSNTFNKVVPKVIKKESKQDTVRRWYKELILDSAIPMLSKEFSKKLMDELGMSQQGSTTYLFNAKKYFAAGGAI